MDKLKLKQIAVNKVSWTFWLSVSGLAMLLLLSGFSFFSAKDFISSEVWRRHSEEVLLTSHQLQLALEQTETAQRGYLLTADEEFLETFTESKSQALEKLKTLQHLVNDNLAQAALLVKVEAVAQERVASLENNIYLAQARNQKRVFENLRAGRGQALMENLRDHIAEFVRQEVALLRKRTAAAEDSFRRAGLLIVLGLLTAFAFLLTSTVFLRQEVRSRRKAEKEALHASELKSSFLANMSHEIRTPLNGIVGMIKVLSGTKLTAEQLDILATLRDSSNALMALINDILDLSKIESGKLQLEETYFELRSLVQSSVSILQTTAQSKGLRLQVDIPADLEDRFIGDPLRLRQVLLNLLNNAIKFSPEGTVSISVRKAADLGSMAQLVFAVKDQGIGMDEATQTRLFQNFSQGDQSTTRRFGGTGLGLAISKQIVELMNGQITVRSKTDHGSTFEFEIPLRIAKYRVLDDAEMVPQRAAVNAHILVAEDNLTNQKVIAAMLKQLSCTFDIANNGAEAIERLRRADYDLILMDGQMPVMDGYESSREIRKGSAGEAGQAIPIIGVTANAIAGDVERCLEAGMDDYVSKPISQEDLHMKIKQTLQSRSRSLDLNVIDSIKNLSDDPADNLLGQLIGIFAASAPDAIQQLRAHAKSRDLKALHDLAHSFKSTCINVGAARMHKIISRIEKSRPEDDIQQIDAMINAVETEFTKVSEELKRHAAA